MPSSTPTYGITYPTAGDYVRDGSVEARLADQMQSLAVTADQAVSVGKQAAIDDATTKYGGLSARVTDTESKNAEQDGKLGTALYFVRELVTGEDVSAVTKPGVYSVPSTEVAASLINLPESTAGVLIVSGPESGVRGQKFIPNTGGFYVTGLATATGAFGPWENLGQRGQAIPDGTNIQTWRNVGPWRVAGAASADTMTGRPPIPAAFAQVTNLSHNGTNGTMRLWHDADGNGVWYQSINANGQWTDWERLGFTRDYAAGHTVAVEQARQGNGGKIGTGGLGVFAIRIDHNMTGMMSKLLPLLRERGLPASMCHFINQFDPQPGYTGDTSTGYGWADVQSITLNDGIEAHSHGWSHQDAVGARALEHEILDSRAEIEAQCPKVRVKGFMVPGTTGTRWGGFTNNLADPSVWSRTEAGRLVMSAYAYANGGGGVLNPLASGQSLGWQSYSIDSSTSSAAAIAVLNRARDFGMGAVLMIHPNVIDTSGYISTATLTEILDHMVAERDAGRALILTVSGMMNADPARTTRHNLVRDPGFASGFTNWAGSTGWTVTGGVASTDTGGLLAQSASLSDHAYAKGSARELRAEFRAPTGAVVRIRACDSATPANWDVVREVTLPASTEWVIVRQPLHIPTTGTATARFEFGRVSGGTVEMRNPGALAI